MKTRNLSRARAKGFTLMELLTVISIGCILAMLTVPAVQGLQKGFDFDRSLSAMVDSFNLARSYAIAQNTYVYVGLTELDRKQSLSSSPQVKGTGRVALSIVATRDGTSDISSGAGANLTQVRQVQTYEALHFASGLFTTSQGSGTGAMARSTALTPVALPLTATGMSKTFSLPLGVSTGAGKYNFIDNTNSAVLCFTPQGGVLLNGSPVQLLEIDLQPMAGTVTPSLPANVNKGNHAALLIDGVTGGVAIYRP